MPPDSFPARHISFHKSMHTSNLVRIHWSVILLLVFYVGTLPIHGSNMNATSSALATVRGSAPTTSHRPRAIPLHVSCKVMAYPSTGGIVIGYLSGVELEWLGIPRSSPASAQSQEAGEEDAFALQLMRLGGRWWPSLKFAKQHDILDYPYGHHFPPDMHIAYSSPGSSKQAVLLLKTFPNNGLYRLPKDAPKKPNGWSRLASCRTMEDRWAVLKDFGATEYDDVKLCPDIPKSLEEGVAEGRQYEQLLKKMQDLKYLDK
ncbi:hypothetical protein F5Y07DRAFT_381423 [Xylaria sp. FL0933]|nr:hypothetical protein F5Y07DRAFT_381423 [Xylaria sp. FL0933]